MSERDFTGKSPSPLLLAVCFPVSIHAARWVNLLRTSPFRVVVFPSVLQPHCPEFKPFRTVASRRDVEAMLPGEVAVFDPSRIESVAQSTDDRKRRYAPLRSLVRVAPDSLPSPSSLIGAIETLRPDLVHSLELQHGAYLCLEAHSRMGHGFPLWVASNWGSDVFLFRKLAAHQPVLTQLLQRLDAFHSECRRDYQTAEELGFRGVRFPPVPASGGTDLSTLPNPADWRVPSKRKLIVVKGYHGWSGRGLHVLLALHRIAPQLAGYQIRVTHGAAPVAAMVKSLVEEDGLDIILDSYYPDHARALDRLAQARVVIGCGISDGISTTLLEAMAVGTFCIQADTACGCEWIESGVGGFIVPPHDFSAMAGALVKAIADDELVDRAAIMNRRIIEARWNSSINGPLVVQAYQDVLRQGVVRRG